MDNQNQNVLDDDRVGRLLLKLTLPAFMGMFVMTLYNVVDTVFIGHFVGPLGIAGLSIVFPLQMMSMGIGLMTGMGGASLISRLIGSGNIPRSEHALGNAMTSTIVLSLTLTIAGLANPDFWLRVMGASGTILPYARDYMTIILGGMVFPIFAMVLSSLIRAEGNARVAMTGMIMGAVLNIIFDAVLIIPLNMGIKGAALATVIAQLISVLYFLRYYLAGNSSLKTHLSNLVPELNILKAIFAIGIASFARQMAASLSGVLVNRMLVTYGGDFAVSAFGIINRIMMFAIMPGIVIGQGLQPILGFNYGARRYDRALRVIKIAILAAEICNVIAFLIVYFVPEPLIGIFTADNELIALGSYASRRIFLALGILGFVMVGSLVFQSIGKATQSFATSISRPALFLIPLVLALPQLLGLDGVWLAFPISDGLTLILTIVLFVPQMREFRRLDLSRKT